MKNLLYFNSYEELSDYCYPFEKNLAYGISDEQRIILLESIAKYYRQRLDEINAVLGYPETILVNISKSARYNGRCWSKKRIIELDISLICLHPLALTEVIVHELTHYEVGDHGKRFYDCMIKNVKKLGLHDQLYGYSAEQREGNSVLQSYEVDNEKRKTIRNAFRISISKHSLYPPIANGTLLNFNSFQEFADFCVPPYKNLPRVVGLLDKIKILAYAEHYYRNIIMDLAMRLRFGHDFSKIKVYITQEDLLADNQVIVLPVWFIGLEEKVLMNFFVRLLTERQVTDASQWESKMKENLSLLGIPEERGASIFLFDFFAGSWLNCFDGNGGKVMEYHLDISE